MKLAALVLLTHFVGFGVVNATDPQVTAIAFQECKSRTQCAEITRWTESARGPSHPEVRVVATIVNSASYQDAFFLLVTTDYMVAPLDAYSVKDFQRLKSGSEASWTEILNSVSEARGRGTALTYGDEMRAHVLVDLRAGTTRVVTLGTLNLDKLLRTSFEMPDYLWPWVARITARLVNREGETVSVQSGLLELVASTERIGALTQRPAQR